MFDLDKWTHKNKYLTQLYILSKLKCIGYGREMGDDENKKAVIL